MKNSSLATAVTFFICALVIACSENEEYDPLVGKWIWTKSFSGYGEQTPASTGHDVAITLKPNHAYVMTDNDVVVKNASFRTLRDTSFLLGELHDFIVYKEQSFVKDSDGEDSLVYYETRNMYDLSGDTLVIQYDAFDAPASWYVRNR
jgi:hypothetical protein